MSQKNLLTIQIIRPVIEDLSEYEKQLLISTLAVDIAEQIIVQEENRLRLESVAHWQEELIKWQIEDIKLEIKYERLKNANSKPQ